MSSSTNALTSGCDGIDITAVTRLSHADSLFGGQREWAGIRIGPSSGVSPSKIGEINPNKVPTIAMRWSHVMTCIYQEPDCKLMKSPARKNWFPKEPRDNVAFQSPKHLRRHELRLK